MGKNSNFSNKSLRNDIAFVGLSHLGLVFSICSASLKKRILAIDDDEKLIAKLSQGTIQITEPGLDSLLSKYGRNIYFSSDFALLSKVSVIFISLDTPTNKPFDLKELNRLVKKIIPFLADGSVLVVSSQVPVGFTRKLSKKINQKRPNLKYELYLFLNTLIIGDSVNRFLHPDRIIIGLDSSTYQIQPEFLKFLKQFKAPILKMSYESAELTKSAINLYLASSIITSNTLADFCEAVGADINQIIPALKSDKRIGPHAYLRPTLRISGGHLERELIKLKALSNQHNISAGIIDPLIKLNNNRINWLVKRINQLLPKNSTKKTITLWGLAYKKDTDSTKNAASVEIIKKLSKKFNFQVYDPKAILPKSLLGYRRFKDKYSSLKNSNILILLSDWEEFKNPNFEKISKIMKERFLVDCIGFFNGETRPEGFQIIRFGVS